MRLSVRLTALLVQSVLAQLVQIGPADPNYCNKVETIRPNLVLHESVHIVGDIRDETSAPLRNSPVELRKYISQRKQVSVKVIVTDSDGRFDLGTIKPGKYRLLASPTRGFKQPSELPCGHGNSCNLKIKLDVNPTDQLASPCPIR